MVHCKASLSNLVASDAIQSSEDLLALFSEAIVNFYSHYCLDDHTSTWCHHGKVKDTMLIHKHSTDIVFRSMRIEAHTEAITVLTAKPRLISFKTLLDNMAATPQDFVS